MNYLELGKHTHLSSFGCSNSTSNTDKRSKNQHKQLEFFDSQKTDKKRESLLLNEIEDSIAKNNLYKKEQKSLNKNNDLLNYNGGDLKDKIKNNNFNKNNLLKMKRKRKKTEEEKTIETNINILFDNEINNNKLKENINDNQMKKTLSLKEKCKNLKKLKIPKNINNPNNIYPFLPPEVQIPNHHAVAQNNNYKTNKKTNNTKKYNKKIINIQNEKYINKLDIGDNFKSDLDYSNLQSLSFEPDKEKHENSFMPEIFESQAPPIIINGIEYTTILVPRIYLKRINLDSI